MKHLPLAVLLLTGLAACSTFADNPTHSAIEAYLEKTLDDPASYEAVRWGKSKPFSQHQADSLAAIALEVRYQAQQDLAQQSLDSLESTNVDPDSEEWVAIKARMMRAATRADSVGMVVKKLTASQDTARVGFAVVHAFRAKNKMGALVLDSARFIVFNDGKITALKE